MFVVAEERKYGVYAAITDDQNNFDNKMQLMFEKRINNATDFYT